MKQIRKLQFGIDHLKSGSIEHARSIGRLACLIMVMALAVGGIKPGFEATKQAVGVRELLQAETSMAVVEPNNPFVCMRNVGNSAQVLAALRNISDEYLRGVGLCMAGENEAGLEDLRGAGEHANAGVQYAAAISAIDPQAGADELSGLGLPGDKLVAVILMLNSRTEVNPYPGLRVLARQANDHPETWTAWLEGSSRLEAAKEWQAALDWISEGLAVAPRDVMSSLYQREGRIYQTQADPLDYQAALAAYNKAIELGSWIYPSEEVNSHVYRGELYRMLREEYGPNAALEEYQKALLLQPGNYSALLDMGYVYLLDLKELDLAESYFREALVANNNYPYAYFYIGDVYRERGDKGSAADWYHQALEHRPNWQPALDRIKALEENNGG